MTPEDIAAFRSEYGDTLPIEAAFVNVIGDVEESLEHLAAVFADRGILPLSKAQKNQIRLCFIYRTMRHIKNIACLARAGLNVDSVADTTKEELTVFITEEIERL